MSRRSASLCQGASAVSSTRFTDQFHSDYLPKKSVRRVVVALAWVRVRVWVGVKVRVRVGVIV